MEFLFVAIFSLILSWIIAAFAGVFSAKFQYSLFDKIVTLLVFLCMSLPSFFIGLLLIKLFALDLGWFPVGGMKTSGLNGSTWDQLIDIAWHMFLPVTVLTMLSTGSLTRYFRTSMLEVIRQDYIRTARAKGLKERTVIFKHARAMRCFLLLLSWVLNFHPCLVEPSSWRKSSSGPGSVKFIWNRSVCGTIRSCLGSQYSYPY